MHELIVAKARQRTANPDIEKHEKKNFQRKPENGQQLLHQQRRGGDIGAVPSAEEQERREGEPREGGEKGRVGGLVTPG